jgi:hypothetical protein
MSVNVGLALRWRTDLSRSSAYVMTTLREGVRQDNWSEVLFRCNWPMRIQNSHVSRTEASAHKPISVCVNSYRRFANSKTLFVLLRIGLFSLLCYELDLRWGRNEHEMSEDHGVVVVQASAGYLRLVVDNEPSCSKSES